MCFPQFYTLTVSQLQKMLFNFTTAVRGTRSVYSNLTGALPRYVFPCKCSVKSSSLGSLQEIQRYVGMPY